MPVFEQHLTIMVRSISAFLNLQVGITRGGSAPVPLQANPSRQLEEARRELESKDRALEKARRELTKVRARSVRNGTEETGSIKPENIVWIFGTGRSGNTWLSSMIEEVGHAVWKEPNIGKLFGEFYYGARPGQRKHWKFVLGDPWKDLWLGSIRRFVLEGASGRFPELSKDDCLVVKEQPGSIGAPLLMEALPESRMILLVRDPRDVAASWLDGSRGGGWRVARVAERAPEQVPNVLRADENPTAYVKQTAQHYLKNVSKAKEAYDAHQGPKVLIRYEELRADTLGTMKRMYSALGIKVDQGELERVVEKHSWEMIPEEEKGEGKFHRRATPGGWQEDLTPEQAKAVEEITAPLLEEFYPPEKQSENLAEKSSLS